MSVPKSNSEDPRARRVFAALRARQARLVVCESCTAGRLAHRLSRCAGAAQLLHGGFVAYTKDQKIVGLGVPAALLAAETAVSRNVALAMAEGALARSPADVAAAITGVAGPEPDEDGNPVGLVCIGVARRGAPARSLERRFPDRGRPALERAAMDAALDLLAAALAE